MVAGGAPGSRLEFFEVGSGSQNNRQAGFLGTITYGRPSPNAFDFAQVPWCRLWTFPASINQGPTAPSPVAFTPATGLGMNALLRLAPGIVDIAQTLPLIRAAAPPNGSFAITPGVLNSAGLVVMIKNEAPGGSADVVISPDPTNPDTIDGGAGPVVVPPGGSRIFVSDGISNWSLVGGYL